ncbi:hypothetical protein N7447_003376 [Penicillium robsamsonii]|uniref:uncharacterized protein n=1 Tax=Penicillium robsamsonii TaxID=1792511 RepID=UPI002548ED38|nr:uncharacterized protein N7447_003376 [Penicillium robsamsonii]KAJ5826613.1 hypothetical protein N7447_003376 [Penicillium robsamsonii]
MVICYIIQKLYVMLTIMCNGLASAGNQCCQVPGDWVESSWDSSPQYVSEVIQQRPERKRFKRKLDVTKDVVVDQRKAVASGFSPRACFASSTRQA